MVEGEPCWIFVLLRAQLHEIGTSTSQTAYATEYIRIGNKVQLIVNSIKYLGNSSLACDMSHSVPVDPGLLDT